MPRGMPSGSRELGISSFPQCWVGNHFARSDVTTMPLEGDEVPPVLDCAHCATGHTVGGTGGNNCDEGAVPIEFHGWVPPEEVREDRTVLSYNLLCQVGSRSELSTIWTSSILFKFG